MESSKLLNFETEHFIFRILTNKLSEQNMLKNLKDDILTKEYLPDLDNYLKETSEDLANNLSPIRCTNIIYKEETPIGVLSFLNLEENIILSYAIDPIYRRNGYMKLIQKEISSYLFSKDNLLQTLSYYIDTTNLASLKTLSSGEIIKKIQDKKTEKEYYEVIQYNPYSNEQRYSK